jgi:hypothetical protein
MEKFYLIYQCRCCEKDFEIERNPDARDSALEHALMRLQKEFPVMTHRCSNDFAGLGNLIGARLP